MAAILVTAVVTNPNKEKHIDKLNEKLYGLVPESGKNSFVKTIGKMVSNPILERIVKVDNYFFFSISKADILGEEETLGYGFLGMVFFTDAVKDLEN
jgi:hypothetical protein